MKCMAAGVADYDTAGDKADIIHLCKNLGIHSAEVIFTLVEDYYPTSRIPIKTKKIIQEIIAEINGDAQ